MKDLLTTEEIEFIIEDSKNSEYKIDYLTHPAFSKTDIMKVSKDAGLILFYGNESTGFKHFHNRHSNISLQPFWKENNKLEAPSNLTIQ